MNVFILRGLPGSGKSTLAFELAGDHTNGLAICSADDFFIQKGEYAFDPSKLPKPTTSARVFSRGS